jgi:hypothetical protein
MCVETRSVYEFLGVSRMMEAVGDPVMFKESVGGFRSV